ncbi:MAG: tRNA (guanosine(46)-N7)-methyltransferase TrmB [Oscillospiraceae bacterium]|nr:tRNA (guanosine(46)-N7)-methyltransferase TrmB [Oscillospiraceae bacterium]
MRLRNRPWAAPELEECSYYIQDSFSNSGNWSLVFGNNNPIWLELGCGKGLFLAGFAPFHPDINFIGADIKSLMLAYARRNLQSAYDDRHIENLNCKLLSLDIERIRYAFSKNDQIDRIFINFPNPWPKDAHKKRRLTHTRQLLQYKEIMSDSAEICFKTDSDMLFEESIPYFHEAGMNMVEQLDDYYSKYPLDVATLTEHEQKFLDQGLPIHFIRATK